MQWCNNPTCSCHPKPKPKIERIQAVLHGTEPSQIRHLHQPGAEFDIDCDMFRHELTLRETIGDPKIISTATQYAVHLNPRNSRLMNINGLPDNSLQVSLEIRPEACSVRGHGLRLETKIWSFRPAYVESKLHEEFYRCSWPTMFLRLYLPQSRIRGWKTVAMLLLTFGQLKMDNWFTMMGMEESYPVAGMNLMIVEQQIRSDDKRKEEPMV